MPQVWKVFSQKALTSVELNQLFSSQKQLEICDWLAYPHYATNQSEYLGQFEIRPNLFHLNVVEWAASAMEMSVISAKNIANFVKAKFAQKDSRQRRLEL